VAIPFFDYPLGVAIFILSHSPKLSSKKREKEGEVFFFWGIPQKFLGSSTEMERGGILYCKKAKCGEVAKWRSGE